VRRSIRFPLSSFPPKRPRPLCLPIDNSVTGALYDDPAIALSLGKRLTITSEGVGFLVPEKSGGSYVCAYVRPHLFFLLRPLLAARPQEVNRARSPDRFFRFPSGQGRHRPAASVRVDLRNKTAAVANRPPTDGPGPTFNLHRRWRSRGPLHGRRRKTPGFKQYMKRTPRAFAAPGDKTRRRKSFRCKFGGRETNPVDGQGPEGRDASRSAFRGEARPAAGVHHQRRKSATSP